MITWRVLFLLVCLGFATAIVGPASHAEPRGPMGQGCAPNC